MSSRGEAVVVVCYLIAPENSQDPLAEAALDVEARLLASLNLAKKSYTHQVKIC